MSVHEPRLDRREVLRAGGHLAAAAPGAAGLGPVLGAPAAGAEPDTGGGPVHLDHGPRLAPAASPARSTTASPSSRPTAGTSPSPPTGVAATASTPTT